MQDFQNHQETSKEKDLNELRHLREKNIIELSLSITFHLNIYIT